MQCADPNIDSIGDLLESTMNEITHRLSEGDSDPTQLTTLGLSENNKMKKTINKKTAKKSAKKPASKGKVSGKKGRNVEEDEDDEDLEDGDDDDSDDDDDEDEKPTKKGKKKSSRDDDDDDDSDDDEGEGEELQPKLKKGNYVLAAGSDAWEINEGKGGAWKKGAVIDIKRKRDVVYDPKTCNVEVAGATDKKGKTFVVVQTKKEVLLVLAEQLTNAKGKPAVILTAEDSEEVEEVSASKKGGKKGGKKSSGPSLEDAQAALATIEEFLGSL